jgi:hypothetical protein
MNVQNIDYEWSPAVLPDKRRSYEWHVFILYMLHCWKPEYDHANARQSWAEWVDQHVSWIMGRPFETPDEWLGAQGTVFRHAHWMKEPSAEFIALWPKFYLVHANHSFGELLALMDDEVNDV